MNDSSSSSDRDDRNNPYGPTHIGVAKAILYSTIVFVVLFVCTELSIRTWAYFYRTEYERYDMSSQTFVLVPGEHRVGGATIKINSDGFIGDELQPNGPNLFRILAIGDSCTFGMGHSYPALLEEQLKENLESGLRYEVVNGGVEGLNSEMALHRLKTKGPALSPDVVTIYIGWNDLMKFDPLSQGNVKRWSGLVRILDKLWLTKAFRKLIFYYIRPKIRPPAVGAKSRTHRFKDFRPSFYERNLRELIATTRTLGARPVLLTLPTVVRADMTVQDLREADVVFPYFPSAYGVGDLLDLLAAYNRSIRRMAMEEQVLLVDLAAAFAKLQDIRPYFHDTMHPNGRGAELIAMELHAALVREDLLERPASMPMISSPDERWPLYRLSRGASAAKTRRYF